MYGVGAGYLGRGDYARNIKVAFRRRVGADAYRLVRELHVQALPVYLGMHGDGLYAKLSRRAYHPAGYLAAVCYEDLFKHLDSRLQLYL